MSEVFSGGTQNAPNSLRVQIEQIAARAALLRAEQSERNAICQEAKARMRAGSHNSSRMRAEKARKAYLDAIASLGGRATTRQIAETIGVTVSAAKAQTAAMLEDGHLQYTMCKNLRVWEAADGSH